MKDLNIYKWASASFSLIPGLVIMMTNLGTPPGISKYLYGGLVEAAGAFTLLLLALNKNSIKEWPNQKLARISISMFILFIISLLTYITFFNIQVIYNDKYDSTLFFPFWYGDGLSNMISKAGSKYNSISAYGLQAVVDEINNSSLYLEFTRIIFTLLYISIFEFLVVGFGFLGVKLQKRGIEGLTEKVVSKATEWIDKQL